MANLFIRAANPIWYFVDLQGLQLDDTFFMSTLQNTLPYLPQPIYHDNQHTVPWSDPIQFYPNGTLPDDMYWDPTLVYRLEIRKGPYNYSPLIYVIENFQPGQGASTTNANSLQQTNQITNPQFFYTDFVSPLVITTAGTYDIGPGWSLVLTGSGSTTITQNTTTIEDNIPGTPAPPYYLEINNNGWTSAILYQKFNNVGRIWQNDYLYTSLLVRSGNSSAYPLSVNYIPSSGVPQLLVTTTGVNIGTFALLSAIVAIPFDSGNTTPNQGANDEIQIVLPGTGVIDLSDITVIAQVSDTDITTANFNPPADDTLERQRDFTFHNYFNSITVKAKNTILTAWNFKLNPWQFQFNGSSTNKVPGLAAIYVTDQTIVQPSATNSLTASQTTSPQGLLQIGTQSGATQGQFAVMQMIDCKTANGYWGSVMSSLLRARIVTSGSSAVKVKMRLIYYAGAAPALSSTNPIAAYDANGDPIFATGWTALKPVNDPAYTLQNNYDPSLVSPVCPAMAFNGFKMPTIAIGTETLAIVIYTIGILDQSISDTVLFDSCSLVPNEFAIDSSPQTFNQVMDDCQFYFERSYDVGTVTATTATFASMIQLPCQLIVDNVGGNLHYRVGASSLQINFKTTKRKSPLVTFYNPANGDYAQIQGNVYGIGQTTPISSAEIPISNWLNVYNGKNSTQFVGDVATYFVDWNAGGAGLTNAYANYWFHYVLDARLGIDI